MSTESDPLSIVAYVAQLEAENAALKERVVSFEAGLESEIAQRVEARDAERKKTFDRAVEARAVVLMSQVGQPVPVSADVTGGDKPWAEDTEESNKTGLARAIAHLRGRRRETR